MTTKSLKATYKPGEIITIVDTVNHYANIWRIVKVGRRYLHYVNPEMEPDKYNTWKFDTTDPTWFILPGARQDVRHTLRDMVEKQRADLRRHESARDNARWDFRRKWNDEHPSPVNPAPAYLAELREEEKGKTMTECIYCNNDVPDDERTRAPELDDDMVWAELSSYHHPDCEWVLTRAHRLPYPEDEQITGATPLDDR